LVLQSEWVPCLSRVFVFVSWGPHGRNHRLIDVTTASGAVHSVGDMAAPRCSARMASFSRLTGDNPPRRFCLLSGAVPGPSPFSSVAVAVPIFSGDLMII
jgi:hypothetical protein